MRPGDRIRIRSDYPLLRRYDGMTATVIDVSERLVCAQPDGADHGVLLAPAECEPIENKETTT